MLLHIIARGKIGRSPEAELTDRYLKRIAWPVKLTELPDRGGNLPVPAGDSVTVLLDERGALVPAGMELENTYQTGFSSTPGVVVVNTR